MQNRRKHTRLDGKAEFCDTTPKIGGGEVIVDRVHNKRMVHTMRSSFHYELGAKKLMPRLVPHEFGAKFGARGHPA